MPAHFGTGGVPHLSPSPARQCPRMTGHSLKMDALALCRAGQNQYLAVKAKRGWPLRMGGGGGKGHALSYGHKKRGVRGLWPIEHQRNVRRDGWDSEYLWATVLHYIHMYRDSTTYWSRSLMAAITCTCQTGCYDTE